MKPLHCPAQQANGVDIDDSEFNLSLDAYGSCLTIDPANAVRMRDTNVEIFGYFRPAGAHLDDRDDRLNDALMTAVLVTPEISAIACIALQIHADDTGTLLAKTGNLLRDLIVRCPCTPARECPAVNEARLAYALRGAVS